MTIKQIRQTFPHIETGRIYFNHAAIGPLSIPVKEKLHQYLEERSSGSIENLGMLLEASSSAKKHLTKLLNAKKNRIAWTENVSAGLNILAQGLKWNSGDRVIINDLEFPSNVYPFLNLKQYGVEIDIVKSKNGKVDVEDYEKLITPKTKLISISAVQFLSGYRADLKSLGELCKSTNVIFCVDAIQATGVIKINVEDCNIDFLAGGSHKWLMSLQGLGYIYITPELMERINQKYVGWLSVDDEWNLLDYNLKLKDNASRFHLGTNSVIGIFALAQSLELFSGFGIDKIEAINLENTKYFIEKLSINNLNPILRDEPVNKLAGITTVKIENAESIYNKLKEYRIDCSLREGKLRFSPHFYNTKEEIDIVVEKLLELTKK
ncbi:MAG: aminotransferase class V-fold PLP-dependent enzyme [Melioribacteraceae bacterium]|nr:MAG: aminotransferase class V-fold PLP-dependent enzyme [Melioribacteraceae bacterium]